MTSKTMGPVTASEIFTLRQVRDPLDEAEGWPLLDPYIEIVYGSILGPTAIQLARMLDRMYRPGGKTLVDVAEMGAVLGVQPSIARHAIGRLERFAVLRIAGDLLILRSHLTPVRGGALDRLPMMARTYHDIVTRNRLERTGACLGERAGF